eukprot:PhM_4_TR6268/c0_g2_i1/m.83064
MAKNRSGPSSSNPPRGEGEITFGPRISAAMQTTPTRAAREEDHAEAVEEEDDEVLFAQFKAWVKANKEEFTQRPNKRGREDPNGAPPKSSHDEIRYKQKVFADLLRLPGNLDKYEFDCEATERNPSVWEIMTYLPEAYQTAIGMAWNGVPKEEQSWRKFREVACGVVTQRFTRTMIEQQLQRMKPTNHNFLELYELTLNVTRLLNPTYRLGIARAVTLSLVDARLPERVRKVHSKWNESTLFDTVQMNELISDISDKCETEFHIEDGGKREVVSKPMELHTFVSKPETKLTFRFGGEVVDYFIDTGADFSFVYQNSRLVGQCVIQPSDRNCGFGVTGGVPVKGKIFATLQASGTDQRGNRHANDLCVEALVLGADGPDRLAIGNNDLSRWDPTLQPHKRQISIPSMGGSGSWMTIPDRAYKTQGPQINQLNQVQQGPVRYAPSLHNPGNGPRKKKDRKRYFYQQTNGKGATKGK